MHQLEELMYQLSGFFLPPVLIVIILLFFYSIFVLGDFLTQYILRKKNNDKYFTTINELHNDIGSANKAQTVKGYDLFNFAISQNKFNEDDLTIFALKNLEVVRVITRIAPMLGLVATMIPMGPALKSLASGNIQGISENLVVAFSAVIFGLIVSSITFWVAAVKKRWLASEMLALLNSES